MNKVLRKRKTREQKTLQLYALYCLCDCGCAGCGSVPANDSQNVKTYSISNDYTSVHED